MEPRELIEQCRRELIEAKRHLRAGDQKHFIACIDHIDNLLHMELKRLLAEYSCETSR